MEFSFPVFVLLVLCVSSPVTEATVLDVTKYGAKCDGKTDTAPALKKAWAEACASPKPVTIMVPKGEFALSKLTLEGPCQSPMTLTVKGTLKAPVDPAKIKGDGWVTIGRLFNFKLNGGGTFDGQGKVAWTKNTCSKSKKCNNLPVNLRFNFITGGLIQDITSLDSKQFHAAVLGSANITFDRFTVSAPGDSPNTDGIHIGRSGMITIKDTKIQTGDDCISMGDGSRDINITGVTCGPGHGISVGSLGKFQNEEPVIRILVKNCTIVGAMNGVRIKTWPASPVGTASDLHFEDIVMQDVGNPVLIDQGYCPWNQCNAGVPSKVKISKVSFKNIRGTSTNPLVMQLICSKAVPCEHVEIKNINLSYSGTNGTASSVCENITPYVSGPSSVVVCSTVRTRS